MLQWANKNVYIIEPVAREKTARVSTYIKYLIEDYSKFTWILFNECEIFESCSKSRWVGEPWGQLVLINTATNQLILEYFLLHDSLAPVDFVLFPLRFVFL